MPKFGIELTATSVPLAVPSSLRSSPRLMPVVRPSTGNSMPDIAITLLVEAFSKFERRKFELAGHALLDSALSMARDILLDDRRVDLHAEVHSLVSVWFDRVCNWRDLLTARTPPPYDSVKLYAENISLFDDAIFELPQRKFDREGVRGV